MRDLTGTDVRSLPGSVRARKRPVPVTVIFAERDGSLSTREGIVAYKKRDALLTGVKGERWPISRSRFSGSYYPLDKDAVGAPGLYLKKASTVWAFELTEKSIVQVEGGKLTGKEGDWLIQYNDADYGIVAAEIFAATYDIIFKDG